MYVEFVEAYDNISTMKNNLALQTISTELSEDLLNRSILQVCTEVDRPIVKIPKKRKKRQTIYEKSCKRTFYQLVPKSILDNYANIENRIKPLVACYKKEYLIQILTIVARHLRRDGGMAKLYMKYLKKQVPQGNEYILALIDNKILQRSDYYIQGLKSFEYSFCADYQDEYIEVELADRALINRLAALSIRIKRDNAKSLLGHTRQAKYLQLLTIDPKFFIEYMNNCPIVDIEKKNCIIASASRITNHDFNCSRDSTSKRLHSNVTNMKTELRRYLRVEGEPLTNIDIKNSQPYLSTLLLTNPRKVAFLAKDPDLGALLKSMKSVDSEDVKRYISLVTSGVFYDYLVDEFKKSGLILTRDETKPKVLLIFFSDDKAIYNNIENKTREIFIELFPTVHRQFSIIRGAGKGENYQNFKRFAILLQRIESYLVLDVIMKKVYRKFPTTFVMTIHDSILTVSDGAVVDTIKNMMGNDLQKFVGWPAQLKIE